MLPGWDSLGTTSLLVKWFAYAGFFALFALGVFEVLAHVYSVHEHTLTESTHESELATTKVALSALQERLQDRTFNEEQHTRLVNMLGVGPRCGVQVVVGVGSDEASRFAKIVLTILHEAGWTAQQATIAQTNIASGIGLANTNGDPAEPCAANLFNVFDSVGMRPRMWKGEPDEGFGIELLIGPKPHP